MEQSPSWEANVKISWTRYFLPFTEPKGSFLYSQQPATDPYPEPDEFNPHPPTVVPF
jgi:hypothetical protein